MIKARGASSAASAANAALDSVRSCALPTRGDDWSSVAVLSDRNPYGIPGGLMYSFPIRSLEGGTWMIVPDLNQVKPAGVSRS